MRLFTKPRADDAELSDSQVADGDEASERRDVSDTADAEYAPEGRDSQQAPAQPTQLPARSWFAALRRSVAAFRREELTDVAAALTYYGILAIFPALIAVVSVLGLIGHSATQPLLENLNRVAPGSARSVFTNAIENLNHGRGAAGILFVAGLAGAIWSASGYVSAFMRASNRIYGIGEGRPFWKAIPLRLAVTLTMVLLLALSCLAVVLTGSLAGHAGRLLGVGGTAVTVWDLVKWPVLVVVVAVMFALLYWASPNVRHPGLRWLAPGGLLAVLIWLGASALFALYVANFGSYNKTYGALGSIVVFLLWLWISNVAVLLGAAFNAELERGRELAAGRPAAREPFLEPRDTPRVQRA